MPPQAFPCAPRRTPPLGGLLRCRPGGCAMTPTFASKNGGPRYRYYACLNAVKHGRSACPSGALAAPVIEALVVAEIRKLVAGDAGWPPIEEPSKWEAL